MRLRLPRSRAGIRRRLSTHPNNAYLDLSRSLDRSVIVLGSARSGTTKLAEALASGRRTRFVLEPMHTYRSPIAPASFVWGDWRAPDADDPELHDAWRRTLSGRVRDPKWLDRFNQARFPTRRVVKCVASTNLTPWLRTAFPTVPIVYVVRDPFAATHSVVRLAEGEWAATDWDLLLDTYPDALLHRLAARAGPLQAVATAASALSERGLTRYGRGFLRWCLENHLALTAPAADGVRYIRFEALHADPARHLADLGAFTGLDPRAGIAQFDRPSGTDFRGSVSAARDPDEWRAHITDEERAEADALLAAFGLTGMFAPDRADPDPPVRPSG